MMTPAWIVCAWPPLLWQASRAPQLHLTHLGTRVLSFGDESEPLHRPDPLGRRKRERSPPGVAWDWVRLLPGVVAMSDPLGLVTNLKLLDDQGEELTKSRPRFGCISSCMPCPGRAKSSVRCIRSLPVSATKGFAIASLDATAPPRSFANRCKYHEALAKKAFGRRRSTVRLDLRACVRLASAARPVDERVPPPRLARASGRISAHRASARAERDVAAVHEPGQAGRGERPEERARSAPSSRCSTAAP